MSDQKNRKAVYTIVEGAGDKKRWIRLGIAFENRDGSFNIILDALPVNGQLHVRDFPPREGEPAADEAPAPTPAEAETPRGRRARAAA